ncbi:hypothetical protein ACWGH4_34805 [Streptomyces sp. NPDC054847]
MRTQGPKRRTSSFLAVMGLGLALPFATGITPAHDRCPSAMGSAS